MDELTRRSFLTRLGMAGLATVPILGCADAAGPTRYVQPAAGEAYFTKSYVQAHSQGALELAQFLASEHMEYGLNGWFFFGGLADDATPWDPAMFVASMQRIETVRDGALVQYVPAIIMFNNSTLGHCVFGGAATVDMEPFVKITANPWSLEIRTPTQQQPVLTMALAAGIMGRPGATYRITGDAPDNLGGRLQLDVLLRDRLGIVNQGYGTSSFFPQYLTDRQRIQSALLHGGSVPAYLDATEDPMSCQGSYYYSSPLMDVTRFTITRDGAVLSSGGSGTVWMDYVVQSYNEASAKVLVSPTTSWQFFAIMLPEVNAAIMVIRIASPAGVLRVGTLFRDDATRTRNGALEAAHSWAMDAVTIEDAGGVWTSPVTGQRYVQRHRIRLADAAVTADLTIRMVRENQEIAFGDTIKYEGLAVVEGTLGGRAVRGTAVAELQPLGHL